MLLWCASEDAVASWCPRAALLHGNSLLWHPQPGAQLQGVLDCFPAHCSRFCFNQTLRKNQGLCWKLEGSGLEEGLPAYHHRSFLGQVRKEYGKCLRTHCCSGKSTDSSIGSGKTSGSRTPGRYSTGSQVTHTFCLCPKAMPRPFSAILGGKLLSAPKELP